MSQFNSRGQPQSPSFDRGIDDIDNNNEFQNSRHGSAMNIPLAQVIDTDVTTACNVLQISQRRSWLLSMQPCHYRAQSAILC